MNQMLITVSTRKFERSVRLPEGDVPVSNDSGLSKSAAPWSFVALSVVRLKEWMARDLSGLGLLVSRSRAFTWLRTGPCPAALPRSREERRGFRPGCIWRT